MKYLVSVVFLVLVAVDFLVFSGVFTVLLVFSGLTDFLLVIKGRELGVGVGVIGGVVYIF